MRLAAVTVVASLVLVSACRDDTHLQDTDAEVSPEDTDDNDTLRPGDTAVDTDVAPVVVPLAPPRTIAPGASGVCVLQADGTSRCFGVGIGDYSDALRGQPLLDVALASGDLCAVRADGTLVCRVGAPPTGSSFVRTASIADMGCAIDTAGMASCWPSDPRKTVSQAVLDGFPSDPRLVELAGGYHDDGTAPFVCAVTEAGAASCWGGITHTFPSPPYRRISAWHASRACALRVSGELDCINGFDLPDAEHYEFASMNDVTACGLTLDKRIVCTSSDYVAPTLAAGVSWTELVVGTNRACGRDSGGHVACFGPGTGLDPVALPAGGPIQRVYPDVNLICIESGSGQLWCSRNGSEIETAMPASRDWSAVDVGTALACALIAGTGEPVCWASLDNAGRNVPEGARLKTIDAGVGGACGIALSDDSVVCWGTSAPTETPTGPFVEVCTDLGGGCARRADGTVSCWGAASGDAGSYKAISCGRGFVCGIATADGAIKCWGDPSDPAVVSDVPAGAYTELSTNDLSACGLKTDGTVVCWPSVRIAASPLPGVYDSIRHGASSVCGRRANSSWACGGYVVYDL